MLEWPLGVSKSSIYDLEHNLKIFESTPLEPLPSDSKIPILLLHRGTLNAKSDSKRLEVNFGWDIVAPKGWGMPLWNLFAFGGAKVGGLRDYNILHFESGLAAFSRDYPETETYEYESKIEEKTKQAKYKRTPKLYRFDFTKTNFINPFAPDFKGLLGIEAQSRISVIHSQRLVDILVETLKEIKLYGTFESFCVGYLEKISKLLQQRSFASKLKSLSIETIKYLYVRVKILLNEGSVEHYSAICLPSLKSELDQKLEIENVMGYITTGGFQITSGKSVGIGCCTLHGLYRFYHQGHNQVGVRTPKGRLERHGKLELIA
ncbi:hypothetical protein HK103_000253 [Boothiomyces macroporosus]|uniref:Uncharacterized protein n=1 Tax=Boothiomyces macroporosus TaxID=261099 RepID=A0AAD5UKL0_9FUNG|nr:hypothetical protein HK103_000253 [Boothiomyces macroporosus]